MFTLCFLLSSCWTKMMCPEKKKRQTELDYYPIKPLTKQADLFGLKALL